MPKLKSRQMSVPGGFKFLQPETGFMPRPNSSFDGVVQAVILHRRGNRSLMEKGLSINPREVEAEVEAYNVKICETMGWDKYIQMEAAARPPKPFALSQTAQQQVAAAAGHVKKIWAGIRTLSEWYESKEAGVSQEQSQSRAMVCVACPLNEPGDFTKWFTVPAAEAIRRQVSKFSERKLSTTLDDQLHVCSACLCVNKLAVHVPLHLKLANMSREVKDALDPKCWILAESGEIPDAA